jgi:hypothetical protein
MGTTYRNPLRKLQPNQINPRKLEKEEQGFCPKQLSSQRMLYKHMHKLVLC